MIQRMIGRFFSERPRSCRAAGSRTLVLSAMFGGLGGCPTEGAMREQLEADGFSAIELTREDSTKFSFRATKEDQTCEGEIELLGLPGFSEVEKSSSCSSTTAVPAEAVAKPAETGNGAAPLLDKWYRVSEVESFDDQALPYKPGESSVPFVGISFGEEWAETRLICLGDSSFEHTKRKHVTYHQLVTATGIAQFRWEDDGRLWMAPNLASADSTVLELERERNADRTSTWHSNTTTKECAFSLPDGHFSVDVQERDADGRLRRFALTDRNGKTWYLLQSQGPLTEKGLEELIFKGRSKAE
jgi:hypothetical protein